MGQGLEIERPPDIEATLALLRQRITELALQDSQFQGAVLVRENRQGRWLAQGLEGLSTHLSIRIYEVGQEARHSHVPGEILKLLQFIHRPHSPDNLKEALQVLSDRQLIPSQDLNALAALPEQFLYPGPLQPPQAPSVYQARRFCTKLLQAKVELPLMDLIGFLGFSLQYDQTELATADKLAEQTLPRSLGPRSRGESGLAGMIDTLREMVKVEKFEPIEPTNLESRYTQSQQLTIITMHKAKGLDWDYVFVPFLQAQTIPGSLWVPPQGQFLGDFTLAEVTRAQIRHYLHRQYGEVRQEARRGWQLPLSEPRSEPRNAAPLDAIPDTLLDTAVAWQRANQLKQQEEYRLLYVAMTRAKRLLWLAAAHQAPFSWQKPENLSDKPPCAVIPMLKASLGNESWVTSNE
jgi:DNA helicase-2/ATP-dependent DNA helicase PcrA